MGSVGDCDDNALAESFFATLEGELVARSRWRTHAGARMARFDFIETFYNPRRRHSATSVPPTTNGGASRSGPAQAGTCPREPG